MTAPSSCGHPHLGHHDFLYCTCYPTSAVAFTEQDVRVCHQHDHQHATGWPLTMTLDGVHAAKLEKSLERMEREWSSVVGRVQSLTSSTPSDGPTAEAVLQVLEREAGASHNIWDTSVWLAQRSEKGVCVCRALAHARVASIVPSSATVTAMFGPPCFKSATERLKREWSSVVGLRLGLVKLVRKLVLTLLVS